jgi:hypothetical protein
MKIVLEENDLRPLVETVVKEMLRWINDANSVMGERIAHTEPEAAALLGVATHVLRDRRLEEAVSASRCGRRIMYQRSDLLRLPERTRIVR